MFVRYLDVIAVSFNLGFHFRLFLTFCTLHLPTNRSHCGEKMAENTESTANANGKKSSQNRDNAY